MKEIIRIIVSEADYDYKFEVERWEVVDLCGTVSPELKLAIQGTIKEQTGLQVEHLTGIIHTSLKVWTIIIDPTIAQFVPDYKGQVFVGDKEELYQVLNQHTVVDPHTGKKMTSWTQNIMRILYQLDPLTL